MDTHAQKRGKSFIEGYYFPRPNESKEAAFARAKAETIKMLKMNLREVEQLEMQAFFSRHV